MLAKTQDGYLQFLETIPDSRHTVVCERHWPADYRTKNVRGKLRPVYPPSVFECIRFSQRPTAPLLLPTKKALPVPRQMEIDQLNEFDEMDSISICKDLVNGLPKKSRRYDCFSIGRTETSAYIQSFEYVPSSLLADPNFLWLLRTTLHMRLFTMALSVILQHYRLIEFTH